MYRSKNIFIRSTRGFMQQYLIMATIITARQMEAEPTANIVMLRMRYSFNRYDLAVLLYYL
jgi:hypothetical protein